MINNMKNLLIKVYNTISKFYIYNILNVKLPEYSILNNIYIHLLNSNLFESF